MSPAPNPTPNPRRRRPARSVEGGQGKASLLSYYTDPVYTTNLCPNPSFTASLAGWSASDINTSLAQTAIITSATGQVISGVQPALYGSQSMQVTTDGSLYNQGTYGPAALVPAFTGPMIGSMTCSIFGETGTLNVSAVSNPGGVVMATSTLVLNGSGWQTVVLNALNFPQSNVGGSVYLLIETAFAQAVVFYVDGVMYEPESPAHVYCDGDQPGCAWSGTAELSASYQTYQWSFSGLLSFQLSGTATVVALGESFALPAAEVLEFTFTLSNGSQLGALSPTIALTDFGIWELTDPDPAQTYAWWTNSGILSGEAAYARPYAMLVPPVDYPVSNGAYAWRRAAYMAVGFQWLSVPNGQYQVMTDVQIEMARTNPTVATTPSAYERPRQLQVIVKPNRLNYITNPAMQVSTAGWSGIDGNEVLSVDTTQYPGTISNYNNLPYAIGQSLCCKLVSSASEGVQISVPYLLPGETYMCSFYVLPGEQMVDIIGSCGTGSADIAALINAADGYGVLPYGSGPYGGINASSVALAQTWVQCSFPFVASTDTCTLAIAADLMTGANYPTYFWVTAVVIEPGDVLNPYFDGNSGPDALWESGGTAGLARSYYYNQYQYGQSIVTATLASNTPLGVSYAAPLYAVVPTQ